MMKDNVSYDLAPHSQHHQQPWNHSRQQQQQLHHSPNLYANQHNSQQHQSRSIGSQQQQQSQQSLQHTIGHYSHQQLHPAAHHGPANPAASAYYQQAHLYPSFQDQQQQQTGVEHQHHHLSSGPNVSSGSATSTLNAVAVAAAHAVHNQQAANTPAPSLNHTGWTQNVGTIAGQAHHAVVTDHSTLAYMTHAYQSHNSSVSDHHRNSTGHLSNQSGPQGSSYSIDSIYNSSAAAAAAAAAVAAYGYNNYSAAFFQTTNSGPHSQTGHPSQTSLSAFWNHNQGPQQRTASHAQPVAGQTPMQQRQQPLQSDQATNYIHDPRLYYSRPPYGQVIQNFGQHQTQPNQQQADIQTRVTNLAHHSLTQPDHQIAHFETLASQQSQQSSTSGIHEAGLSHGAQLKQVQQANTENHTSQGVPIPPSTALSSKLHSPNAPPQPQLHRQPLSDSDKSNIVKNKDELDRFTSTKYVSPDDSTKISNQQSVGNDPESGKSSVKYPRVSKDQPSTLTSMSSTKISQHVIKNELVGEQNTRKHNSNSFRAQPQGRNVYRATQEERVKTQTIEINKKSSADKDPLPVFASDNKTQSISPDSIQIGQSNSIEDTLANLSVSSRKTTWASIASQPAKVAPPKSLKSKIAGPNSVLSSAKHIASSVTLDPAQSLESKNSINPTIKSSASAATLLQRASVPPPISKVSAAMTALKLDLTEDDTESSKISWPVVNASINLTLDDPPIQKNLLTNLHQVNKLRKDDDVSGGSRDSLYRDHNHNRGINSKIVNNEDRREDHWGVRRDQRDNRVRGDSDRKEPDSDKRSHEDSRKHASRGRDFRTGFKTNHFRDDEPLSKDRKRGGPVMDRNDYRGNDNFSRYPQKRYEHPRDPGHHLPVNNNRENETVPHHHYSNLRDGNSTRAKQGTLDISLHPHLNPANYNPKSFNCEPPNARYFIIKSYSEDDIHRSIKYSIWCSTNHGNKRLDEAYRQQEAVGGPLYLFFSVNGSGHFCGMAQMTSVVDFDSSSGVWAQSKWQGEFSVKWIYVKDVPNSALRHITLENNEDKPVTNSRDTQEVPSEKGKSVLAIIHKYHHTTSLFDDFLHYERRQEEEKLKRSQTDHHHGSSRADERGTGSRFNRSYGNPRNHNDLREHPVNRDRSSRY